MNVKYLYDYLSVCKKKGIVGTWEGLKQYHTNNKGVY